MAKLVMVLRAMVKWAEDERESRWSKRKGRESVQDSDSLHVHFFSSYLYFHFLHVSLFFLVNNNIGDYK